MSNILQNVEERQKTCLHSNERTILVKLIFCKKIRNVAYRVNSVRVYSLHFHQIFDTP